MNKEIDEFVTDKKVITIDWKDMREAHSIDQLIMTCYITWNDD